MLTLSSTNTRFACYIVTVSQITLTARTTNRRTAAGDPLTVDLARQTDLSAVISAYAAPAGNLYLRDQITFELHVTPTSGQRQRRLGPGRCRSRTPGGSQVLIARMTVTFDPAHPLVITSKAVSTARARQFRPATPSIPSTSRRTRPPSPCSPTPLNAAAAAARCHVDMRARGFFV